MLFREIKELFVDDEGPLVCFIIFGVISFFISLFVFDSVPYASDLRSLIFLRYSVVLGNVILLQFIFLVIKRKIYFFQILLSIVGTIAGAAISFFVAVSFLGLFY